MTSPCGHSRRVLWPESGLRTVDPDVAAARRHAEECTWCRAFFAEMAAIRDAVRASVPLDEMPVTLREDLFERLAESRRSRARARWGWLLAAASIAGLALGILRTGSDRSVKFLASTVVGEHATAVGGDRLASTDPLNIERWLASRLPFGIHVPVFREARLDGARICLTDEGRCAVVEYAIGERRLSYFVLPAPDRALSEERRIISAAESGYRVVLWRDAGLIHALVGSVGEEQLIRLARECMEQAMRLARRRAPDDFALS